MGTCRQLSEHTARYREGAVFLIPLPTTPHRSLDHRFWLCLVLRLVPIHIHNHAYSVSTGVCALLH